MVCWKAKRDGLGCGSLGRRTRRLRVGTVAAAMVAGTFAGAQSHVIEPADLANLRRIEGPRISPDGRLVAYAIHTPTAAGKPRNEHIWLVDTIKAESARPFAYSSGMDTSPAWSPDGKHLAFLSDRPNPLAAAGGSPFPFSLGAGMKRPDLPQTPDGTQPGVQEKDPHRAPPTVPVDEAAEAKGMQLWWIALDGGEAEPLTNLPGGVRSFQWSKDGTRIALIRTDTDSKAQRDRKEAKNDEVVHDQDYRFDRLWVLDLGRHEVHLVTQQDANIDAIDWSPDGRSIVARVSPTPRIDDYWRVSKVEILDAATGEVQQTIEEHSGYQAPVYSQDGLRLGYSRFTPRGITDVHLVRTLATGQEVRLEDTLKGTIAEMRWTAGNRLLVNAYVGAHTEATLLDPSGKVSAKVAGLPLTALDLDVTPSGSAVSYLGETPAGPAEVAVWRAGNSTVLTRTNPQTAGWALGTEREITWTNPKDHRTVFGVLSLPPGYVAGRRYKTVVHLHGGPEEAFTVGFNASWYNYAALLASQGYVVLQPNYRGSAGQEIAFTEGDFQDWGGGDFADVMSGVDAIVAQGIADGNRLAIAGWSYGGFLTGWAVTHTDRFKVAMAGAPVTDLFSMATTTDIAPRYATSYMGELGSNVAEYDRHSSVRSAAACHTPVLLLHGAADVRVPTSQSEEFYHALRFLGRTAELVTYPREPHIFSEREHQIDSLTRELEWFQRYLPAPGTQ